MTKTWRDDAACRGRTDLDWFRQGKPPPEVRALCAACPVQAECLADDLSRGLEEIHYFRAGMTAPERRRLLRSDRPPRPRELMPCGTAAAYRRHLRGGDEACTLCKLANANYQRLKRYECEAS